MAERPARYRTHRRPDPETARRGAGARRRRQEPGGLDLVRDRRRRADAGGVLRLDGRRPDHHVPRPDRQLLPDPGRRPGPDLDRRHGSSARCWPRSRCRSCVLVLAAIAGNLIQHRLVWSTEPLKPKFSQDFAAGRLEAAVLQPRRSPISSKAWSSSCVIGAVMLALLWPQRYRLEGLVQTDILGTLLDHPLAVARRARRGGRRAVPGRRRRLPVPVPAMVRAPEDVAPRDEGGVQADRRRSAGQGQDPAVAPGADAQAHDGQRCRRPPSSSPTRPTTPSPCNTSAAWTRRSASPRASMRSR